MDMHRFSRSRGNTGTRSLNDSVRQEASFAAPLSSASRQPSDVSSSPECTPVPVYPGPVYVIRLRAQVYRFAVIRKWSTPCPATSFGSAGTVQLSLVELTLLKVLLGPCATVTHVPQSPTCHSHPCAQTCMWLMDDSGAHMAVAHGPHSLVKVSKGVS